MKLDINYANCLKKILTRYKSWCVESTHITLIFEE